MCDSVVVIEPPGASPGALPGAIWLAKNSDRQADEAQFVERLAARTYPPGAALRCTHLEIPQASRTLEVILSRPRWMWGCEMGVNAAGVTIANEAVFTRIPVARHGLTGMDLQRLALERATTAEEAIERLLALLADFPQGGAMAPGGMRYHSSFLIADPGGAWVLETAGPWWALARVRDLWAISNALTIGGDFDRIHPGAYAFARSRGWCRGAADFSFARAFGRPLLGVLAGAGGRRRCVADFAGILRESAALGAPGLALLLRDHHGRSPADGWRMGMPCAHASPLPTRSSGQTTASMIVRLGRGAPRLWMTGTSSPCLSVFKPVPFGDGLAHDPAAALTVPALWPDDSLWWRHERLHRVTLLDYARRRAAFESARERLQAAAWAWDPDAPGGRAQTSAAALWREHHAALPGWLAAALDVGPAPRPLGWFRRYWAAKARELGLQEALHGGRCARSGG